MDLKLLLEMGITVESLREVDQAPSLAVASSKLEALKLRFKREFNRLALSLHPDQTGGDPKKTEKFKRLCQLKVEFETLQAKEPTVAPTEDDLTPPPIRIRYYPVARKVDPVSPDQKAYRTANMTPSDVRPKRDR
jgi:hypothetical protein